MKNYVITIARGFGSGGKSIAKKLAQELEINWYENQILVLASQLSGIDEQEFAQVNEKVKKNFLSGLLSGLNPGKKVKVEEGFTSDDKHFAYQKQIIQQLADTESCIIVGKCADWILKDRDNVISIYIEAPRSYCRPKIMERTKVSAEVANKSIESTDKYRAEYYKYYTGGRSWTDPVNYDITLNVGRIGEERCVELIKDYVGMKFAYEKKDCI